MSGKDTMEMEPTESSPLRPDLHRRIPQFEPLDVEKNLFSVKMSRNFGEWAKPARLLIAVLVVTLVITAIVLVSTISFTSSEGEEGVLKAAEIGEENVLEMGLGKLKWSVLKSRENRNYYAFYKVPYAKPPIGELRFESPQPPEKWEGIRNETEVAPQCLQKSKYSKIIEAVGDEDCLYLNIYTPKLPGIELSANEKLMPVMFYIHGGGFTDGNGSRYGGKYFMDEDCVLITFQYRLGIFGFLSSEDGTIKANMALKDQVQALKWVRENIKDFGGDPERVMIYGNSAGAMGVNSLMASPMAVGLFQRAITQSGPSFGGIIEPHEKQLKSFELLSKEVGCWSTLTNEKIRNRRVLKCLREQNASDIAVIRGDEIIFRPAIETYQTENEGEKFFPEGMHSLLTFGKGSKVPWMLGVNNKEWVHRAAVYLRNLTLIQDLQTNWNEAMPPLYMAVYDTSPVKDNISIASRQFYFGDKVVSNDTIDNFTDILSDRDIVHGTWTQAQITAKNGGTAFLYYLSKRPPKSYSDKVLVGYPPKDYGASHADELQYFFDYYGYPEYPVGSEFYQYSRDLVRIWVQFAATGSPGWDPVKTGENPVYWQELNDQKGPTKILQERMNFWDQYSAEELCYSIY